LNECPSLPQSKMSSWGIFCIDSFIKEANRKIQSLKNNSRALKQQREREDGGRLLLGPSVPLEYILGLQIIESTIKKTKETFQWPIMVENKMMKQSLFCYENLKQEKGFPRIWTLKLKPPSTQWSKDINRIRT